LGGLIIELPFPVPDPNNQEPDEHIFGKLIFGTLILFYKITIV
jgi:hypothetical protein